MKKMRTSHDQIWIKERWQMTQFQNLPLDVKIAKSRLRIREWYEHYGGQVNVVLAGNV